MGPHVGPSPCAEPDLRYPHLGFNPAPGDAHTVRALHRTMTRCGETLAETRGVIAKLMDGSTWRGDAATAFRDRLENGPLPLDLKNAAHSLRKAARQLERWESDLTDFQRRAARLDTRAADAHHALTRARRRAAHAADDPDLHTSGHRRTQAERALHHLTGAAENAAADLDHILTQAHHLAEEHQAQASRRARAIRNATLKLAPHEPGAFDDLIAWTTDNLPDILSTLGAVVGLAALIFVTGGTAAPVLLLVGAALSASALATRLVMDPTVVESIKDGFAKGEFDADFWSNLLSVLGDGLGVLPGLGAVGKGAYEALNVARESGEVLTLGQHLAAFGRGTLEAAHGIEDMSNPVLTWAVRGVEERAVVVEKTAAAAGVATGASGLASTVWDPLDRDQVKEGATVIDGANLVGPGVSDLSALALHLFGS